jgi:hypothetical protein
LYSQAAPRRFCGAGIQILSKVRFHVNIPESVTPARFQYGIRKQIMQDERTW